MASIAGSLLLRGRREPGIRPSEPGVAAGDQARRAPRKDDEYLRHQRDSRRPGPAGSAAAERARLMKDIARIENALTKRVLSDGDEAAATRKADRSEATPLWESGRDARGLPRTECA